MKRMTCKFTAFLALCSLLSIFAVPAMAWDWPCPDACYYWNGYNCLLSMECGIADPCPGECCINCSCVSICEPNEFCCCGGYCCPDHHCVINGECFKAGCHPTFDLTVLIECSCSENECSGERKVQFNWYCEEYEEGCPPDTYPDTECRQTGEIECWNNWTWECKEGACETSGSECEVGLLLDVETAIRVLCGCCPPE